MKKEWQQGQKPKQKKRAIDTIEGLRVFAPGKVYFNEFLTEYIGAPWQPIKNSLYDAGYTTREVMEYRDGLLSDFYDICERNGLHGIV